MSIIGNGLLPQFGGEDEGIGGISAPTNLRVLLSDRNGEFADAVIKWDLANETRTSVVLDIGTATMSLSANETSFTLAQGLSEHFFEVGESRSIKVKAVNGEDQAESDTLSFTVSPFCTAVSPIQSGQSVSASWTRPSGTTQLRLQFSSDAGATWSDASGNSSSTLESDTLASGYWSFSAGSMQFRVLDVVSQNVSLCSQIATLEVMGQPAGTIGETSFKQAGNDLRLVFFITNPENCTILERRYKAGSAEWSSWQGTGTGAPQNGPYEISVEGDSMLQSYQPGTEFQGQVRMYSPGWESNAITNSTTGSMVTIGRPSVASFQAYIGGCSNVTMQISGLGSTLSETGGIEMQVQDGSNWYTNGQVEFTVWSNGSGSFFDSIPTPPFNGDGSYTIRLRYYDASGNRVSDWSEPSEVTLTHLIWTSPNFSNNGNVVSWTLPSNSSPSIWDNSASLSMDIIDLSTNNSVGGPTVAWSDTSYDIDMYVSSGVSYEVRLTASNSCSSKTEAYIFNAV